MPQFHTFSCVLLLAISVFLGDIGAKTLFLEDICSHKHWQRWFFFSNDLLQVLYTNIIVLDGKLGDL